MASRLQRGCELCYFGSMHTQFRSAKLPLSTQAGEGLPRRRWTTAELEAMVAAEIIVPDERFELIGGDVVIMQPKGLRHEMLKASLSMFWAFHVKRPFWVACATTFRQAEDTYFETDFVFLNPQGKPLEVIGSQSVLAVEIADNSLEYDLGRKALCYAAHCIPELWVIDAVSLRTHVHRKPAAGGYGDISLLGPEEALALPFAPDIVVRLNELEMR
jgi:Uma2 family endonuclease